MAAVWSRTRAELRRRMAATIWLMIFLGVAGGAVLGALAGARRTDTAYPRMLEATNAGDVLVSVEGTGLSGFYDDVAQLPGVAGAGVVAGVDLIVAASSLPHGVDSEGDELLQAFVSLDEGQLYNVNRPVITAGRLPDPNRPDEGFANRFLADQGLDVGATLTVHLSTFDPETEEPVSAGDPIELTIVGTGVFPYEVVPVAVNDSFPSVSLTPAFFVMYVEPTTAGGRQGMLAFDAAVLRLDPRTDVALFRQSTERLIAKHEQTTGSLFFLNEGERNPIVQRAVRPQVVALQLFAGLTAATALLLVGQAVTRQLYGDASDNVTLRALGMTRRQLFAVGMIRTGLIGAGGAIIATVVGIALSPITPLGPARLAEPDPGLSVDGGILGLGAIGIVAVLLLALAAPVLRHARGRERPATERTSAGRSSLVYRLLSGLGAPTAMTAGVRMAMEPGKGPTSAPVRSATLGTVLAVTALAATVTFGSSIHRLTQTPRLYGQTWDLTIDAGFGVLPLEPAIGRLTGSPDVESFSAGIYTETIIDGVAVPTILVDPIKGSALPTLLEGRTPRQADEIALGTSTLRKLGRRLGDAVELRVSDLQVGDQVHRMRIVGRVVFPLFGEGSFSPTGLGEGALATTQLLPPPIDGYSFFLVNLTGGAAATESVQQAVKSGIPECEAGFCFFSRTIRPGDVTSYERVRATPLVLAGLLALLAAAAVGHALVSSVRRRARDLAILKTVGFVRRQVSSTVAWQATTMMVISLMIGIPAGVAAGRAIWNGFADRLGVPAEPIVPMLVILLGVVGALILANVAAAWPGLRAARLSPAVVLRNE